MLWIITPGHLPTIPRSITHPNVVACPLPERRGQSGGILFYIPSAHQTGEQTTCRAITLHVQRAEINCD